MGGAKCRTESMVCMIKEYILTAPRKSDFYEG